MDRLNREGKLSVLNAVNLQAPASNYEMQTPTWYLKLGHDHFLQVCYLLIFLFHWEVTSQMQQQHNGV
jgi:hypothetical protein